MYAEYVVTNQMVAEEMVRQSAEIKRLNALIAELKTTILELCDEIDYHAEDPSDREMPSTRAWRSELEMMI